MIVSNLLASMVVMFPYQGLLFLVITVVCARAELENTDDDSKMNMLAEDDTMMTNVTRDPKSLFLLFVKPNLHHLIQGVHGVHGVKHPQHHRPSHNTPCGKPHCPGSAPPTGPSPTRSSTTSSPTPIPATDVNNCTCISSSLCLPSNTVTQGEGVINPRALCQAGLVCCLVVPSIPVELARMEWARRGGDTGRYWGTTGRGRN